MPTVDPPQIDVPMSAATAKRLAWVAWFLVIIGLVTGSLAAMALVPQLWQQVASGASVISMLVATEIRRQLPSSKALRTQVVSGVLVLLAAGTVLAGMTGCLAAGYKSVGMVAHATNETGKALAAACKLERKACDSLSTTEQRKACYGKSKCPAALKQWVDYIYPGIRAAEAAAYGSLETARQGKDPEKDWKTLLPVAACWLTRTLLNLKPIIQKKADEILGVLAAAEGFVCKEVSP